MTGRTDFDRWDKLFVAVVVVVLNSGVRSEDKNITKSDHSINVD